MKTYTQIRHGEYEASEQAVTLRANGGDCGGGSEALVVETYIDLQFGRYEKYEISSTLRVKEPFLGRSIDC